MKSCHKILEEVNQKLKAGKRHYDENFILNEYILALEFIEKKLQPQTPLPYLNYLILKDGNSLDLLLKQWPANSLVQKLYQLTSLAALKYPHNDSDIQDLKIPFFINPFENAPYSALNIPLTAEDFIQTYEKSPNATEMFFEFYSCMKHALKRPCIESENAINFLVEYFIKNPMASRNGFSILRLLMNTVILILYPEMMNQKKLNLCGVASLLFVMLRYSPDVYVNMVLDLFKNAKHDSYFKVNLPYEDFDPNKSFHEILMVAIKKSVNFFGYFPNSTLLEKFGGVTRPSLMVNLLENMGFQDVKENICIKNTENQEISVFGRMIVGGLYSSQHQPLKRDQSFLKHLEGELAVGKAIILCVGPSEWTFGVNAANVTTTSILNIRVDHYVTLLNIAFDENESDTVEILYMDPAWKGIRNHKIKCSEAMDVINGAIIATPPSQSLEHGATLRY